MKRVGLLLLLACHMMPLAAEPKQTLSAVTLEYPPFSYTHKKSGQVIGASPDLLKLIFNELGYELNIKSLPWKRSQQMIEQGKAHIIFTYTRSHQRQDAAYYSNPISTLSTVFIKNIHSKVPSSWAQLSDLKHYSLGINGGYNYPPIFMQALKDNLFTKLKPVVSKYPTDANLRKILTNRIDYFICSADCSHSINKLPKEEQGRIKKINQIIGGERTLHVGFVKHHTNWKEAKKVRDDFNVVFEQVLNKGKVKVIYDKYNIVTNYKIIGSKLNINWDTTLD